MFSRNDKDKLTIFNDAQAVDFDEVFGLDSKLNPLVRHGSNTLLPVVKSFQNQTFRKINSPGAGIVSDLDASQRVVDEVLDKYFGSDEPLSQQQVHQATKVVLTSALRASNVPIVRRKDTFQGPTYRMDSLSPANANSAAQKLDERISTNTDSSSRIDDDNLPINARALVIKSSDGSQYKKHSAYAKSELKKMEQVAIDGMTQETKVQSMYDVSLDFVHQLIQNYGIQDAIDALTNLNLMFTVPNPDGNDFLASRNASPTGQVTDNRSLGLISMLYTKGLINNRVVEDCGNRTLFGFETARLLRGDPNEINDNRDPESWGETRNNRYGLKRPGITGIGKVELLQQVRTIGGKEFEVPVSVTYTEPVTGEKYSVRFPPRTPLSVIRAKLVQLSFGKSREPIDIPDDSLPTINAGNLGSVLKGMQQITGSGPQQKSNKLKKIVNNLVDNS